MNSALNFKNLDSSPRLVPVIFDNTKYDLPLGMSLAAALLLAGVHSFRQTTVSQSDRGPFCMMGACYDCLVEIDGITQQACMTQVSNGLIVNRVKPPQIDDHE